MAAESLVQPQDRLEESRTLQAWGGTRLLGVGNTLLEVVRIGPAVLVYQAEVMQR